MARTHLNLQLSPVNPAKRETYKFWVPERVRYADLEVQRHVNNMIVGVYFQSARIAMLRDLDILWSTPEHAIVLARTINDYYKELTYPNELEVGACVTRMGNTSFDMMFGVFVGNDCYASQEAIAVYWNPVTHEKRSLDGPVREKLARFLVD
ncbi:MAG TPA: acyl-CoA thioesterase [Alphaproteobacteria bacterium]|nr:acyl-CoA thioesterase [Rhodospirillaceae bacterium]HRJ12385.1 acyl-CoA thioesterase [Alphaproteobacteria bacterium]